MGSVRTTTIPVPNADLRVMVLTEILSANGFNSVFPISIHFIWDLPQRWTFPSTSKTTSNEKSDGSHNSGVTQSSKVNKRGEAHFSHTFENEFIVDQSSSEIGRLPILFLTVMGIDGNLLRTEGFGYETLPSRPGNYILKIQTWKPSARNITDKMKEVFLGFTPELEDPKSFCRSNGEEELVTRLSHLGLETEGSGTVVVRFRIIHQLESLRLTGGVNRLSTLDRMTSVTILKNVQEVIEAFQKARQRAIAAKSTQILRSKEINS